MPLELAIWNPQWIGRSDARSDLFRVLCGTPLFENDQPPSRPVKKGWNSSPGPSVSRNVLTFVLWCLLFFLCWPLALAALVLYPIVWLLLLPLKLVGVTVHGALSLVSAVIMLPARVIRAI